MKIPGIPYVQGINAYPDRDGRKYAIAIHNTSNSASDTAEAAYAGRRTDDVSSHFYCDSDSIIQSLDTTSRAGHAGNGNGNENAVAVEITGVNAWTRNQWLNNVAWDKLGNVLAQVCKEYGIAVRRASVAEMKANPKVKAFYSHDDMRLAWGGTTHTDPGPNFPWDRLFQAVNTALNGGTSSMAALENTDPLFLDLIFRAKALLENVSPTGGPGVGQPNKLAGALAGIASQASSNGSGISEIKTLLGAAPPVVMTPADRDAIIVGLYDQLAQKLGPLVESAAEAAVRNVLGALDGATP